MTSPGRHAPADAAPGTAERHPIVETARVGAPLDGPGIKHECGVFGIWAPGADVARLTFFALYALQHRGQESAGIATTDGKSVFVHRGLGLVTQAFDDEAHLRPLVGDTAIGHCRYSTRGANSLRNAQPFVLQTLHGPLGVAHNGNITNAHALRRDLLERGIGLSTASDSELLLQHLAFTGADPTRAATDWPARLRRLLRDAEGAYSLAVLTREGIYAIRDPHGFRPLCIGELPLDDGRTGYIIASESCALAPIGARHVRDVQPGEIVRVGADGIRSWPGVEATPPPAFCVFEYVYFARPDSDFEGRSVHLVRQRYGERLALEAPADADVVVGVPDSALPAAIGYARQSGLPYIEGLTKNRYIGRTFIQPDARLRRDKVRLKYTPLRANLEGKRVVLIDDSIVRGSTAGPLVRLMREGGATEVHVRVSSPPVRHPCFMGVDLGTYEQIIAHQRSIEEIRQHIGADSLAYLSLEGMIEATREGITGAGYCHACFSGRYPIKLEDETDKLQFEDISGA
ncbi:MAG: amidophosphoribosyltransferase [Myxococcales bacterium]|nr:amidophosphoribosyltransferase [Myxococcales bacterium]